MYCLIYSFTLVIINETSSSLADFPQIQFLHKTFFLETQQMIYDRFIPFDILTERKKDTFLHSLMHSFLHLFIHYCLAIILTSFSLSYFGKIFFFQGPSFCCFLLWQNEKNLHSFIQSIHRFIYSFISVDINVTSPSSSKMLKTCFLHWPSPFLSTQYRTQSYFFRLSVVTERKKTFFRASLPGFIHLSIHYCLAIILTSFAMSHFRKICFFQGPSLSCFLLWQNEQNLHSFYLSIHRFIYSFTIIWL